jgi:WD40 repeat protein
LKQHTRAAVSVIFSIGLACVLLLLVGSLWGQTGSGDSNSKTTQKSLPSSIQIEPTDPGDVPMPPEFRLAIYENLITQIEKSGRFQHVYRSGDKDAASVPDLITLRTTAQSFKKGSQKEREVTTVAGSSSIILKVHITDHAGQTLVDRNVEGKVRFFGENLRATYDFSKKVATIVRDAI